MNIVDVKGNNNTVAMGNLVINHGEFTSNIGELLERRERMVFRHNRFISECKAIEQDYYQNLHRKLPIVLSVLGLIVGISSLQAWLPPMGLFVSTGLIVAAAMASKQNPSARSNFIKEVNYYTTLANQQAEQIRIIDLDIEFVESKKNKLTVVKQGVAS